MHGVPSITVAPRVRAPRAMRGGACVELLLSVPFLFLFSVATFDFVRGGRAVASAHRAARHLAWANARHAESDDYPAPPDADATRTAHFYGTTGVIAVATKDSPAIDNPVSGAIDTFFELFNLEDVGRGVVSFLTGQVDVDYGTVGQKVDGLHFFPGAKVEKQHLVSLRSRPEADPGEPVGWFDPFNWLWGKIKDLFS